MIRYSQFLHKTRYTSQPLPKQRYVPGQAGVHPQDLHSHQNLHLLLPNEWRNCEPYLYGVDLFNHAFWWEAHEAWEGLWLPLEKSEVTAQFLQGLIQISAGYLKQELKQNHPAKKLFFTGVKRLKFVAEKFPRFMGVSLEQHISQFQNGFYPPTISLKNCSRLFLASHK